MQVGCLSVFKHSFRVLFTMLTTMSLITTIAANILCTTFTITMEQQLPLLSTTQSWHDTQQNTDTNSTRKQQPVRDREYQTAISLPLTWPLIDDWWPCMDGFLVWFVNWDYSSTDYQWSSMVIRQGIPGSAFLQLYGRWPSIYSPYRKYVCRVASWH